VYIVRVGYLHERIPPHNVEHLVRQLLDDLGPGVVVLVHAVPEAGQLPLPAPTSQAGQPWGQTVGAFPFALPAQTAKLTNDRCSKVFLLVGKSWEEHGSAWTAPVDRQFNQRKPETSRRTRQMFRGVRAGLDCAQRYQLRLSSLLRSCGVRPPFPHFASGRPKVQRTSKPDSGTRTALAKQTW
jgi:hypothetical protein